jgi:hypothetical protein
VEWLGQLVGTMGATDEDRVCRDTEKRDGKRGKCKAHGASRLTLGALRLPLGSLRFGNDGRNSGDDR